MTAAAITASCWRPPEPEPAPPEPEGFGRGPYDNTLVIQADGEWLRADFARRYLRAQARLAAEGIDLSVVDAGRTYEEQVVLWNKYGSPRAAKPGTSNHEWKNGAGGTAIDIDWPYFGSNAAGARKHEVLLEEGFIRLWYEDWHYSESGT